MKDTGWVRPSPKRKIPDGTKLALWIDGEMVSGSYNANTFYAGNYIAHDVEFYRYIAPPNAGKGLVPEECSCWDGYEIGGPTPFDPNCREHGKSVEESVD